jgi:hypothetical protein
MAALFVLSCSVADGPGEGAARGRSPGGQHDAGASCPVQPEILWLSESAAEPLIEGDTVTLVHGPQGGWHVGLDTRIHGRPTQYFEPYVFLAKTGEQLAGADNGFQLPLWGFDDSTCTGDMAGMFAYLDDSPEIDQGFICGLVGQELLVGLVVTDELGAAAEVSVVVVATPDPADPC